MRDLITPKSWDKIIFPSKGKGHDDDDDDDEIMGFFYREKKSKQT